MARRATGTLACLASAFVLASVMAACSSKGGGGSGRNSAARTTPKAVDPTPPASPPSPPPVSPPPAPAPAPTPEPPGEITGDKEVKADVLTAAALTANVVYTNGSSSAETCVNVGFTAKKQTSPVPDLLVSYAIVPTGEMADPGKLDPVDAKTNAEGLAVSTYCSGATPGKVTITARVGTLSSNSAEISVSLKPTFNFRYARSDLDPEAKGEGSGSGSEAEATADGQGSTINLNLLDAGPKDCTQLYFKLTRDGAGVSGKEITFRTQVDYPKGAKLAKKGEVGKSATDAGTGKKFGTYVATSSSQGVFAVPVCAGVDLGTIVVSGVFSDEEAKTYDASSPVISINAGLTNYANMSLTFDPLNAKIIRGYFNTNADETKDSQAFLVKLGARQDGDPIADFPVAISAETGKITVENSGYPKPGEGTVGFKMLALHMVNYRPYPVITYNTAAAQTRCDAYSLSLETTDTKYSDLRRNWRSTFVYMVRGQEHFNDANKNGIYDGGGDGFWDKNQNGVYDAGDVITSDAGNDGLFSPGGEWFIDLPTPYIDVDDDNAFTVNKDIIVGDAYSDPNGQRDADTLVWKSEVVPIYLGTSPFAMRHGVIKAGALNDTTDLIGQAYFTDLGVKGLRDTIGDQPTDVLDGSSLSDVDLFGVSAIYDTGNPSYAANQVTRSAAVETWRYFFAHDVCGNPPPGQTEIKVNFEEQYTPKYGARAFTAHFYTQPGDSILEPSRRLLASAAGSADAKVNFNVTDHPANAASYPIEFKLATAGCTSPCGGVAFAPGGAGLACDAHTAYAHLTFDTDTISTFMSIGSVKTCTCDPTAYFDTTTGSCLCPAANPNWDGNDCKPAT